MSSIFKPLDGGSHFGYRPNGLPQTPDAMQHVINQTGAPSQAGVNHAIQSWAGFNLLNSMNSRLAAAPLPVNAELMLALGGNHLRAY